MLIGKVSKPHGVKGGIKVESFMDTPYAFSAIKEVEINATVYKIEKAQVGQPLILKLSGVDTVEAAEKLRNAQIFINKERAPQPPDGRYYVDDLIGCRVLLEGEVVGELTDILQYGSADIYCVSGAKNFMFPYVGEVIAKIDIASKEIVLNEREFDKVAVYED
ncbi:MAG: ribosome maturation factor RimM [Clostridia bacterium]|nr:ribosome maturation factor RimM [Clostridia bacterium]